MTSGRKTHEKDQYQLLSKHGIICLRRGDRVLGVILRVQYLMNIESSCGYNSDYFGLRVSLITTCKAY